MSSMASLYPTPGAAPAASGQPEVSSSASQAGAATASSAPGIVGVGATGMLATFEGFLKKAGRVAGTALSDIVKYVIPVASVVAIADPGAAAAVEAFVASVKLVQTAVITVQQRWANQGSEADAQKLADVLAIVEEPVVLLFAQVGVEVNVAYVTNLVNGVVAMLNAQPGIVLPLAP